MNPLSIDTSTEILSVALRHGSAATQEILVAVRDAGLRHTRRLMLLVDGLLTEAGLKPGDLDLVSCMRGPGSFTGLRIGMASAKGLAWAVAASRGLETAPIVSVSTLDAMAAGIAPTHALVVPVIDGRKGRFYGAGFRRGDRLTSDLDLAPPELLETTRGAAQTAAGTETAIETIVTGPHAARFVELVEHANRELLVLDPGARRGWAPFLLDLAEARLERAGYDPTDQGPDYVRDSDAALARSSKAGEGGG
jgi:tRNA threonylcarbamoyladenosine biosynthesis protein TsaB